MEVVLQWLDELDDCLFAGALLWERLRRGALKVGLSAAFALAGCELFAASMRAGWVPALAAVSLASVGLWLVAAAVDLRNRRTFRLLAAGA
ncbi:MAG TPA: hypothetical protein VFX89_02360 [Gammaproteobacteria bacterium]|nr:hypothetical protein [Gammaproteobacteria bacterium]